MAALTSAELNNIRAAIAELLPDTCHILSSSSLPDGQGGVSQTWGTATANVACRLDYVRGQEIVSGGAVQVYTGWILTLPHNTTVSAVHRVNHSSGDYAITGLDDGKSWQASIRATVEKL